jgi:hypothetical protein
MQAFGNRIYFGHGDYGDNTGPIPLHYFDPVSQQFLIDRVVNASNTVCGTADGGNTCVDDEEINNIRVIDGKLYVPGIDAKEPSDEWFYGNFYVRDAAATAWIKYRTIPGGIHVFDLYRFADPQAPASPPRLFAGTGPTSAHTSPMIATNDGVTIANWSNTTYNGGPGQTNRINRFFALAGQLYASGVLYSNQLLLRYDGGVNFSFVPYSDANRMFPDKVDAAGNSSIAIRVFREVYVGSQMVYLGVSGDQSMPFGLYRATGVTQAQTIVLPVANVRPMDLLLGSDGVVYVLGQTGTAGNYTNYVFSSANLSSWTEVLRFSTTTFARSFEYLHGYFFFGLGTTRTELSTAAGDILQTYNPLLPPPTSSPTGVPTPTVVASPTAVATATATPTPAPRPDVGVSVGLAGAGRLWATLAARSTGCPPSNQLLELRFGDDPRLYRNAAIEIDGPARRPPFAVSLPAGTVSKSFVVVQLVAGADATVPVTARDSCGEWSTFVGGGSSAFQPAAAIGSQPALSALSPTPTRTATPTLTSASPTATARPR